MRKGDGKGTRRSSSRSQLCRLPLSTTSSPSCSASFSSFNSVSTFANPPFGAAHELHFAVRRAEEEARHGEGLPQVAIPAIIFPITHLIGFFAELYPLPGARRAAEAQTESSVMP